MIDLVLGGEGLIGRALCQELASRGSTIRSLDLKNGFDLRLAEAEWFTPADRVWFLAWDTGGAKYLGDSTLQHQMFVNNCEISIQVFDFLKSSRKPFVFVTSQLAGQENAYGLTKLMAENWAKQLGGKVAR